MTVNTVQVVEWINMPQPLHDKFTKQNEHYFGQQTYHTHDMLEEHLDWEKDNAKHPELYPDFLDREYCEMLKEWLISEGVDLEKPFMVLVDW